MDDAGVVECTKTIFNNYNNMVTNDDVVFFLGDVFLTRPRLRDIGVETTKRRNGKKILMKGNHDELPDSKYLECFCLVKDYLYFDNLLLCHYPDVQKYFKELDPIKFKVIIHGHIHNKQYSSKKYINACVDYVPNGFKPVYSQKLTNYITNSKQWPEIVKFL